MANFRDLLILVILGVLCWKLFNADLALNIQGFNFSEFLSMLMAFFAVSLSAAFYFKATDTSNEFYNNQYKFTKDVSEILGRIEAGFGERLRHIDEGTKGLRDKLENYDITGAKKEVEEKQDNVEKRKNEVKTTISDIMERASLPDEKRQTSCKNLKMLKKN